MTAGASSEESDRNRDVAASRASDASVTPETSAVPDRCYRHPMREALVHCTRCDRPICPDCMRPASVGFHCPDDVKLASREQRVVRTSVGAPMPATTRWTAMPLVTWTLVALNVVIYLITGLSKGGEIDDPRHSSLYTDWFLSPPLVANNHEYVRLIGSAFLHADIVHIALNMFALWIIGPPLERLLGWWRFAAVYLLAGFGGGVAVYAFGARSSHVVGASGAIYGLFAACLFFVAELGFDRRYLIGTIVINFVFTVSVPNISLLGHVGGFVVGGLASFALAGVPWARRRLSVPMQAGGLVLLLAVLIALVSYRTAVIG
jgi:membrane associated rhomboid family serine protease